MVKITTIHALLTVSFVINQNFSKPYLKISKKVVEYTLGINFYPYGGLRFISEIFPPFGDLIQSFAWKGENVW